MLKRWNFLKTGFYEGIKYATVYEFEHEMVNKSAEWAAARDADPRSIQFRSHMSHAQGSPGAYSRIFPL